MPDKIVPSNVNSRLNLVFEEIKTKSIEDLVLNTPNNPPNIEIKDFFPIDIVYYFLKQLYMEDIQVGNYIERSMLIEYLKNNFETSSANTQVQYALESLIKKGANFELEKFGHGNWWFTLPIESNLDLAYEVHCNNERRSRELKRRYNKRLKKQKWTSKDLDIHKDYEQKYIDLIKSSPRQLAKKYSLLSNFDTIRRGDIAYLYLRYLAEEGLEGTYASRQEMVGYFEKWGTYLEKVNTPMRVRVSKSLKAYQKQSIDFEFQGPRANIWFKIPKKSVLEESYDNMIGKRSEIKPKKIKTKAARKKPKKRGIKVSKRKIPKKKAKPKITKKKVVSFSKPLSLSPSQQHLSSSIQEILSLDPSSFSKKYNIFQKDRNSIDEVCLTYVFMKGLLNLGVKPRTYIPRSELLKYYYFGDFQKTSQGVAQNLENALEKGLEYFSQRNIDFKPISKKEGLSYSLPTHLELDKAYFEINFLKDEAPKTRAMRMLEDFQIQSLPDNVLSILRKSRTKYEIAWELAHTYQRSKRVLGSLGRAIYNLKKEQKIRQEKGILYKR